MARQLPRLALTGLVGLALATPLTPASDEALIARYEFEAKEALATGPDTFAVFRPLQGDVSLTRLFRFSGEQAVLLRDVPADGEFPELQGYFPERTSGTLVLRFALMSPDPQMPWNVALAGPKRFVLQKDGIAFWLKAEAGVMRHVSDSIPKKLLAIRPYVWYLVEVRYDIDAGRYDLSVREENATTPQVALRGQPNATASPASSVDKFSFVGDVEYDAAESTVVVDDIVIATSPTTELPPFVAPGRRALFVTTYLDPQVAAIDAATAQDEALAQIERGEEPAVGYERAGDAAYRLGTYQIALERYIAATDLDPTRVIAWLKRADMHYLLHDLEGERNCRERIFGALEAR